MHLARIASIALGTLACQVLAEEPAALSKLAIDWDDAPPLRSGPLAGFSAIVKQASPSVVAVLIQSRAGSSPTGPGVLLSADFQADAIGSGVILTEDGYIVTSSHVVESAEEIRVLIPGREKNHPARLIGADTLTDIAVIKLDMAGLPAASLARDAQLAVGDLVLTIGNPFGLEHTVTSGIVSGLARKNLSGNLFENYIQTDAPINPGSSGGALIDNRGRVVGITGAMVSDDGHNAGVGFAEPIASAVAIARSLIADGEIQRGYIGLQFAELNQALATAFGLESPAGALVGEIATSSPAEAAGLQPGDVIIRYESTAINSPRDLELLVAAAEPGSSCKLSLVRFGTPLDVTLLIAKLPPQREAALREDRIPAGDSILPGLDLANLDAGSRIYFGVPAEVAGVIVIAVEPGSTAASAGIGEGDVILQIGRETVASLGQAVVAREKAGDGAIILRLLGWDGVKFAVLGSTAKN